MSGQRARARARLAEAIAGYTDLDDPWGRGVSYFIEGELEEAEGNLAAAAAAFAEGSMLMRHLDDAFGVTWTTLRLGYVRLQEGDLVQARPSLKESLGFARDLGHTTFVLLALAGCAALAADGGHETAAVRLFGRAARLLEAPPEYSGLTSVAARAACGPRLSRLRRHVPPERFQAEWSAGHALTLEQAITLALDTA
jgi:hypothetical protein